MINTSLDSILMIWEFPAVGQVDDFQRLARSGGKAILKLLGDLLVLGHIVKRVFDAVVAGTSSELMFELAAMGPLNPSRSNCVQIVDAPDEVIEEALEQRGYTSADAKRIIDTVGTRLRLLEEAFLRGAGVVSADAFIAVSKAKARHIYEQLSLHWERTGRLGVPLCASWMRL